MEEAWLGIKYIEDPIPISRAVVCEPLNDKTGRRNRFVCRTQIRTFLESQHDDLNQGPWSFNPREGR